jgi:hypothetical protein
MKKFFTLLLFVCAILVCAASALADDSTPPGTISSSSGSIAAAEPPIMPSCQLPKIAYWWEYKHRQLYLTYNATTSCNEGLPLIYVWQVVAPSPLSRWKINQFQSMGPKPQSFPVFFQKQGGKLRLAGHGVYLTVWLGSNFQTCVFETSGLKGVVLHPNCFSGAQQTG